MKLINRICIVLCVAIVCFLASMFFLVQYVPLGSVGVKTQQYGFLGAPRGVAQKDYAPGWHPDLLFLHSWTVFDATVQTIEMTRDPSSGDQRGRDDVQLKSSDGYTVSLDLTIKYRIKEGEAHKMSRDSGTQSQAHKIVRSLALDTFREVFGSMKTEDFYDPEVREQKTEQARQMLGVKLNDRYIDLLDILIREIVFDPQYEKKILDKKLADQEVELNKSLSVAAEKKGETDKILAEADAEVKVIGREMEAAIVQLRAETERQIASIRAEAQKYATQTIADADLYSAELVSRGTALERSAEAQGERLKALALMGPGGGNYVALRVVEALDLTNIAVSTLQTDFLDVDGMVRSFGANDEGNPTDTPEGEIRDLIEFDSLMTSDTIRSRPIIQGLETQITR